MSKKRIDTSTSRTAEWTCLSRAISSIEKDPCYRSEDQIAVKLLPRFIGLLIRIPFVARAFLRLFTAKGIYEYVIARTKYIDAVCKECLSNGFTQIVIFGAGFDTRALRFQVEAKQARIFELDSPTTQEAKIGQYRKRKLDIPDNLIFVPIDFDKESIFQKLDQAGFREDEKTLFILEGILMYLQPESVDQTFQAIRELASPGSELVFDYIYASVLRHQNNHYGEKGAAQQMSKAGEQWHFGIEEGEIKHFLEQYGFELRDHRNAQELEKMYFQDPDYNIVGCVNGTHCLTRARVRTGQVPF